MKRIERDGRERVISMEEWRGEHTQPTEPTPKRGRHITPSNDVPSNEDIDWDNGLDLWWVARVALAAFGMAGGVVMAIKLALWLMR